jgi:cytochrome c biogenesis protein
VSTVDEQVAPAAPVLAPPPRGGPGVGRAAAGAGRRLWRWLTSMRTALILLFLLAVAAIPGSLLPQRNVNAERVSQYYSQHPALAPWLDRLSAFNVFGSPWFSSIYLLLFLSLIGCLVPRLRAHLAAVLRVPPEAPSRLDRLPAHAGGLDFDGDPAAVAQRLRDLLRRHRFRVKVRAQPGGGYTVSAEKGHVKETGNILFHFALLTVLIAVALGSWYGYHADRLLVQGPEQGFCNTLQQYDDYGLGARVSPADLEPFCLELTGFQASYQDNGQPADFSAAVRYTVGDGPARAATIKVNQPLRLARARIYLLGHGYAPVLRYTDRYGRSQTVVAPFPRTDATLTSSGVIEFPDANIDPAKGYDPTDKQQVAFAGLYLPTVSSDTSQVSAYPAERNPMLFLTPYRGDLGLDAGIPTSVYALDQHQIATGRLKPVGDVIRLVPGGSATLDDGTRVEFLGTRPWITATVRYDPGEHLVLVGAVLLLSGLVAMLLGRRLRVWFRLAPHGPASAGALARSAYPGFTAEFDALVREARQSAAPGGAEERGVAAQRRDREDHDVGPV